MWTQESGNTKRAVPHYINEFADAERPLVFAVFAGSERAGAAAKPGGRAAVRLTCIDRAIIKMYFRGRRADETKFRAVRRQSHRQLREQWLPGWQLPSKLRVDRLSRELECKLSVIESGYARVIVNGEILLIDVNTRRVFDVMQAVDGEMSHAECEFHRGSRRPDPHIRKCGQ
jgi:hypothetical protein